MEIENPRVPGSNPGRATTFPPILWALLSLIAAFFVRLNFADVAERDPQRQGCRRDEGEVDEEPEKRDSTYGDADRGQDWDEGAHDEPALDDPDIPHRIPHRPGEKDGQADVGEGQPIIAV